MLFFILHADNLLQQMLLIVNRVPRLFPDILQDKPGQHVFIDGMGGTGALAAAGVVAAQE